MSSEQNSERFIVAGKTPIDTADGRVYAPGDTVEGLDLADRHNEGLVQTGRLVRLSPVREPTKDELLIQAESLGLTGLKSKSKDEVASAIEAAAKEDK